MNTKLQNLRNYRYNLVDKNRNKVYIDHTNIDRFHHISDLQEIEFVVDRSLSLKGVEYLKKSDIEYLRVYDERLNMFAAPSDFKTVLDFVGILIASDEDNLTFNLYSI